jgi:hypothetical protein
MLNKNKLFVYGIFLDKYNRRNYGMENPEYAVVEDYATYSVGGHIVEARPCKGAALTGLLVKVTPFYLDRRNKIKDQWRDIDALEWAYDKIVVTTTLGDKAYMYVGKEESEEQGRVNTASSQASQAV